MSGWAIQGSTNWGQSVRGTWPVLSGLVPHLAESYTPRTESGLALATRLEPGGTAVLVTADEIARELGAVGGTGKTQLAAAAAHTLWDQRAVDLLVWVTASSRDAVLTGYAQALGDVGQPEPYDGPEAAALHFLAWLAGTDRPWLAVIDDLADPAVLEGLWPRGASGRVVVTTNRADTARHAQRPRVTPIGGFSRREALNYLHSRLHADPDQWVGALDLATEVGFLPIILGQAGALLADTGIDCREYRMRIVEQRGRLSAAAGIISSTVAAAGALSIDRADRRPPAGLAWPALALTGLLDPNGIPGAVLTSQAACAFLSGFGGGMPVSDEQARAAVRNLARVGLVTIDTTSANRTVRAHTVVQALVRQALSAGECEQAGLTAADALAEVWTQRAASPRLEQALRDCTARLRQATGALLLSPEPHPVLLRAGESLSDAGLAESAIGYWQAMIDATRPILGSVDRQAIGVRARLADAYQSAGEHSAAIAGYERLLADCERGLGPEHPDTLSARSSLARAYGAAGRAGDAIRLAERALADTERTQGPQTPDTVAARSDLAQAYLGAGLSGEAIAVFERTLAVEEQVAGPDHPDTLTARANLAHAYRAAGRFGDALPLFERILASREKVQGPDDPATLAARGSLASAYRAAGRTRDAIGAYKRTLADRERVQGHGHPDTITARGNLADAYHQARKLKDALPLYEQTLADREHVLGPDHPDTLTARGNLASAYHSARKLTMALPLYERTLAGCERVLGPDHPDTLTSRGNLAHAYHTAGRLTEALALFKSTLADCERVLGPDHPLTTAARQNYDTAATT
jgi:tetratricopeptide (TPR) repeat protein